MDMSQVDDAEKHEAEVLKKLSDAAKELAKLNNNRPLTKEESEELTRRAT
jgi:hypothetical protein